MTSVEECNQAESEPPNCGGAELQPEPDADPLGWPVKLFSRSSCGGNRRLPLPIHRATDSLFPFHSSVKVGA